MSSEMHEARRHSGRKGGPHHKTIKYSTAASGTPRRKWQRAFSIRRHKFKGAPKRNAADDANITHGLSPSSAIQAWRSMQRARANLDITVPTGTPTDRRDIADETEIKLFV